MPDIKEISEELSGRLDEAIGETESDEGYVPQYRMIGASKIPVSKAEGRLWKTRLSQCKASMKDVQTHWEKALQYYNIDHVGYRMNKEDDSTHSQKLKKFENCKENVIFTNTIGMLPNLYSQNPSVNVTPEIESEENSTMATTLQRLINIILQRRVTPGVNMQPKARKAILNAMITNRGIIKIGWTNKNMMNDHVLNDINTIAEKLQKAKEPKEIEKLEGQLSALSDMVDLSEGSSCYVQHIMPTDLFIDPTAQEQDGSDAKWIMERTLLPTEWLKAKYGFDINNEVHSVYKNDQVLKLSEKDDEDDMTTLDTDTFDDKYGYDSVENYKKSQLSECFWIWDKVKRRVYLYSGANWDYPVWVYDDPYHLQEFYPYYILNFIESPNTITTHGEISLYLDQQDEINLINAQLSKMRNFGFNHYLFNTNAGVARKEIENWANGKENIVGINLPPNTKFEDVLFAGQVPADKNQVLYEKGDLFRQIDAASGTDATIRSGEYKTNTTNLAIQTYQAGKSVKLDDKRDLIERWLGHIAWGLAQICLQFMSNENIQEILGTDYAQSWRNYTAQEIKTTFSLQCVGGSTQRPNSAAKQQQALQITQLLGQFASATPMVVLVMLRMLARAFDSFIVREEDITTIIQSIEQQLQAQAQQAQMEAQNQQAQSNLAQEQANTQVVDQAAQIQQMTQLPESVQNTILNNVLNQPQEPAALYGSDVPM